MFIYTLGVCNHSNKPHPPKNAFGSDKRLAKAAFLLSVRVCGTRCPWSHGRFLRFMVVRDKRGERLLPAVRFTLCFRP